MRSIDLIIRGGKVVTPDGVRELEIATAEGRIVELAPSVADRAPEEIDAAGLHVFPGVIDAHVHFNEPGRTEWEGFATGSSALAAGGGTCFFDMPLNSSPPTLDGASFDLKLAAALAKSVTDFALWGGLTPNNLDKLEELADRGVVGFKAFMCPSGIDDFLCAEGDVLEKGMAGAARLGLPVAVHAEDAEVLDKQRRRTAGQSWRDYLDSRPVVAEGVATRLAMSCASATGCSLHVVHVSCDYVVDTIASERRRGTNVTCETCPHYLLLCEDDLLEIGARAKCAPPLREQRQLAWLTAGLGSGAVDFVASDHSPAPELMKRGDDAFAIWGGIAGVQSTLPALLSLTPALPPERVAALTAGNVATRFGIPGKGAIAVGNDADLALVDVAAEYTLTCEMLLDRHKLSPYVGRTFRGLVRRTIVRGHTVFRDGRIVAGDFRGRLVRPERGGAHA